MHNILAKHFGIALGKVATVLTNTHVGDCGGIAQSHKVPIAATPIGKNMKNPRRFFLGSMVTTCYNQDEL
jgi:hypothetical protein